MLVANQNSTKNSLKPWQKQHQSAQNDPPHQHDLRPRTTHSMSEASIIAGQLTDVRICEGDQFLLYMRNLPDKVQEFLQLHQNLSFVSIAPPMIKSSFKIKGSFRIK